jgi:bacillopeptidase F
LEQFSTISLVDYENNTFLPHDSYKVVPVEKNEKSIGGIELGLKAINAEPMWNLGYTGRGQLVFNYDTGVWPTHPAFANRFLAHYKPMSQSWHGYHSPIPNGAVNDHGTHTLGTIAGLDTLTKDTIGVAFNAYWIANDLINTTTQTMPPLTVLIESFQWAMNPDGDINTSDDIPDVISNSWRWYDGNDTLQCGGFIVGLMNAVEAAGIANVFAGGNMGPSNATISAPQRINTSEVNTFSVGAVDGNQTFPYPIASFSSRGPKQCPATGALLIHPEVVAPGVNVRSSFGSGEYAVLSGTSMATPHVSGAILLLKEAFPNLTGEDFLWALYLTAIDMGVAGEDNTFGRGMIDVYAAFQYLAQTNTPVDPLSVTDDLSIRITEPIDGSASCDSIYSPKIMLRNLASNAITSATIYYSLNGGAEQSQSWTGNLAINQEELVALPVMESQMTGSNNLKVRVEIDGQPSEYDLYNNQYFTRFNIRPEKSLPFSEDFEHGFYNGDWQSSNPDGKITWSKINAVNKSVGDSCMAIKMYSYYPSIGQTDDLISPKLNLPAGEAITLKFDWAYYRRSHSLIKQDTLRVLVKTNCETVDLGLVFDGFGLGLETGDTLRLDFVPRYPSHWLTKKINLSAFAGQQITLVFESVNHNGNNLYLDNITVYSGDDLGIFENKSTEIAIFPNPNQGSFELQIPSNLLNEKVHLVMLNLMGKVVYEQNLVQENSTINASHLVNGLYIVKLTTKNETIQKRFIKQ